MMEETITTGQIAKKYGLIYGLVALLAAVIPMVLETQAFVLVIVPTIIAAVMYILADKEFKTANGGFMSFGEGFKINMVAALIASVIRAAGSYLYMKVIDPDYLERARQMTIDKFRESGMTEEMIEQNMRFAGGTNVEIQAAGGILWAVLGALVVGSIVAAILKHENEEAF